MPRASRYLLEGYTYHLTHRCRDRRFLLKFAEEREALWSESLAVGSREYIERIKKEYWQRSRFDEECVQQDDQAQTWVVRESRDAYASDSEQKSAL